MGMAAGVTAADFKPSGCPTPSKRSWETSQEAKRVARLAHLNFYRCRCGSFHLTSGETVTGFTANPTSRH